jgi:hypothetical protein
MLEVKSTRRAFPWVGQGRTDLHVESLQQMPDDEVISPGSQNTICPGSRVRIIKREMQKKVMFYDYG